ncbi:uncharacterized protein N0V89_010509 [Didymosphaeria variabile]|uniref:Bacteriophage T5 Orf172 DNA-binding domain-containing protein n=1 Tax=Didymosphaeria variabile TaxID=1932322 RepID=A0A9W8XBR1_9PLEO|nr:uncharacterized protein N0V89_010509 [Didymosphaeria variabile]KAJ4346578.1 hypothetical protein N0V89_010509 [Didymosphaeria variabile]
MFGLGSTTAPSRDESTSLSGGSRGATQQQSLFGGTGSSQQQSLFGSRGATQQQSLFGGTGSSQQQSLFGSRGATQQQSLFGSTGSSQQQSLFGSRGATQQQSPSGSKGAGQQELASESGNNEDSDGEESDGEVSDGEESDGEESDGEESDGEESDGEESDGEESDGEESDGEESDGEESDDESPSSPFQHIMMKDPYGSYEYYQTITCQHPYSSYSLEELRCADYAEGRKFGDQIYKVGAFGQSPVPRGLNIPSDVKRQVQKSPSIPQDEPVERDTTTPLPNGVGIPKSENLTLRLALPSSGELTPRASTPEFQKNSDPTLTIYCEMSTTLKSSSSSSSSQDNTTDFGDIFAEFDKEISIPPLGRPSPQDFHSTCVFPIRNPAATARRIRKILEKPLTGYIYVLQAPEFFSTQFDPSRDRKEIWVKIGISADVNERIEQIRRCGITDLEDVYVSAPIRYDVLRKIEAVCHEQLNNFRRYMDCKSHGKAPKCMTKHDEWFAVPKEVAIRTVSMWTAFLDHNPYGHDGALEKKWADSLNKFHLLELNEGIGQEEYLHRSLEAWIAKTVKGGRKDMERHAAQG